MRAGTRPVDSAGRQNQLSSVEAAPCSASCAPRRRWRLPPGHPELAGCRRRGADLDFTPPALNWLRAAWLTAPVMLRHCTALTPAAASANWRKPCARALSSGALWGRYADIRCLRLHGEHDASWINFCATAIKPCCTPYANAQPPTPPQPIGTPGATRPAGVCRFSAAHPCAVAPGAWPA